MNLLIPRPDEPIQQGGRPASREWFRFFQAIVDLLGFSNRTTIYRDYYTLPQATGAEPAVAAFNSHYAFEFDSSNVGTVMFSAILGNDYKDGTDLSPFCDWGVFTAASGDVRWELSMVAYTPGDVVGTGVSDVQVVTAPTTQYDTLRTEFTDFTGTDLRRGDVVFGYLERDPTHGDDDFSGNAALFGVGFKYQAEGVGTEVEQP